MMKKQKNKWEALRDVPYATFIFHYYNENGNFFLRAWGLEKSEKELMKQILKLKPYIWGKQSTLSLPKSDSSGNPIHLKAPETIEEALTYCKRYKDVLNIKQAKNNPS